MFLRSFVLNASLLLVVSGCGDSHVHVVSEGGLLLEISDSVGPASGGVRITLYGDGFVGGGTNRVYFGQHRVQHLTLVEEDLLRVTLPAGTPGVVDVRVENSLQTSVLPRGFFYFVPTDLIAEEFGDLFISASNTSEPGRVFVFAGGPELVGGAASTADVTLIGQESGDRFGSAVVAGDVNGDGYGDLVVGAPGDDSGGTDAGAIVVFFGGDEGVDDSSSTPDWMFRGTTPHGCLGAQLRLGDLDRDGVVDIIGAAPGKAAQDTALAAVYVFFTETLVEASEKSQDEPPDGEIAPMLTLDIDANLIFESTQPGDGFALALDAGDVNDDGLIDLAIGAANNNAWRDGGGAVFVFLNDTKSVHKTADEAEITFAGALPGGAFGVDVAIVDVDRDGIGDVVASSRSAAETGVDTGVVWIFQGASRFRDMLTIEAWRSVLGEVEGDLFGNSLRIGDVTGDGKNDVVVTAPGYSRGALQRGRVYIFDQGAGMPEHASRASVIITGDQPDLSFGSTLDIADISGDEVADITVGSAAAEKEGAGGDVRVFFGGSDLESATASEADAVFVR